jgi:gamma-glutamylcyclotransferase (GGCT)/AIG2-like uncharacterized protein YtfP
MLHKLFVYGTLTQPNVQREVWKRTIQGSPDALDGYTRTNIAVDGVTYPLIIPKTGSHVDGIVLELDDQELIKVDAYETDYQRILVTLQSGTRAWVYAALASQDRHEIQ